METPKKSNADTIHAVARSGLGAIPFAGTAAVELLNSIASPPLERRRNEWMEEVGNKLKELEEKTDIILEELQQNENFIDVSIEATQIALKTSLNEKKEALRNATLNAALTCSIDKSLQKMFLSFIDILTVWRVMIESGV